MDRTRRPITVGEVFERLTVIGPADPKISSKGTNIYRVKARCICGSEVVVYESKLRAGVTRSCGCLQVEKAIKSLPPATHGMTRTPTYLSWQAMHYRCENPGCNGYERYGGAGISVCERWSKFENFLADMGIRPDGMTLDRIDSTKNYEPGNCRWATWIEQESNRKDNRFVIVNGDRITLSEAERRLKLRRGAIKDRANRDNDRLQEATDSFVFNLGNNVRKPRKHLKIT